MVKKRKNFRVPDQPALPKNTRKFRLNLFDMASPDIGLFNSVDAEQIKLTGSEVTYFKYFQDSDYDDVFGEDRGKGISPNGILLYAHYDPRPVEENLTEFGLEMSNDQMFVFNKDDIEELIGRAPIPGDQILTSFQNIRYEIHEAQEAAFRIYGVYHWNCYAKVLRDNQDTLNVDQEFLDDEF